MEGNLDRKQNTAAGIRYKRDKNRLICKKNVRHNENGLLQWLFFVCEDTFPGDFLANPRERTVNWEIEVIVSQ